MHNGNALSKRVRVISRIREPEPEAGNHIPSYTGAKVPT